MVLNHSEFVMTLVAGKVRSSGAGFAGEMGVNDSFRLADQPVSEARAHSRKRDRKCIFGRSVRIQVSTSISDDAVDRHFNR